MDFIWFVAGLAVLATILWTAVRLGDLIDNRKYGKDQ